MVYRNDVRYVPCPECLAPQGRDCVHSWEERVEAWANGYELNERTHHNARVKASHAERVRLSNLVPIPEEGHCACCTKAIERLSDQR